KNRDLRSLAELDQELSKAALKRRHVGWRCVVERAIKAMGEDSGASGGYTVPLGQTPEEEIRDRWGKDDSEGDEALDELLTRYRMVPMGEDDGHGVTKVAKASDSEIIDAIQRIGGRYGMAALSRLGPALGMAPQQLHQKLEQLWRQGKITMSAF